MEVSNHMPQLVSAHGGERLLFFGSSEYYIINDFFRLVFHSR